MHRMKYSAEEIIEQLKREYAGELAFQAGQRRRKFSSEFKRRLFSEAKSNRISKRTLALGLGISHSTVCNWRREMAPDRSRAGLSRGALFQKLEVEPEAEPHVNRDQAPYLEGKSGVRVVGLSLSQMAELLRCL